MVHFFCLTEYIPLFLTFRALQLLQLHGAAAADAAAVAIQFIIGSSSSSSPLLCSSVYRILTRRARAMTAAASWSIITKMWDRRVACYRRRAGGTTGLTGGIGGGKDKKGRRAQRRGGTMKAGSTA